MAFVRHLEFAKFRCFDRHSPWELKCVFAYQILSNSDNSRLRYWDKAVFKMAAVCHLEFAKFQNFNFLSKVHPRNGTLHLHTKFDRNRIHSWDMVIIKVIKVANSLIVNLYLPCVGTIDRLPICDDTLEDLQSWRDKYCMCDILVAGDLNCSLIWIAPITFLLLYLAFYSPIL